MKILKAPWVGAHIYFKLRIYIVFSWIMLYKMWFLKSFVRSCVVYAYTINYILRKTNGPKRAGNRKKGQDPLHTRSRIIRFYVLAFGVCMFLYIQRGLSSSMEGDPRINLGILAPDRRNTHSFDDQFIRRWTIKIKRMGKSRTINITYYKSSINLIRLAIIKIAKSNQVESR